MAAARPARRLAWSRTPRRPRSTAEGKTLLELSLGQGFDIFWHGLKEMECYVTTIALHPAFHPIPTALIRVLTVRMCETLETLHSNNFNRLDSAESCKVQVWSHLGSTCHPFGQVAIRCISYSNGPTLPSQGVWIHSEYQCFALRQDHFLGSWYPQDTFRTCCLVVDNTSWFQAYAFHLQTAPYTFPWHSMWKAALLLSCHCTFGHWTLLSSFHRTYAVTNYVVTKPYGTRPQLGVAYWVGRLSSPRACRLGFHRVKHQIPWFRLKKPIRKGIQTNNFEVENEWKWMKIKVIE